MTLQTPSRRGFITGLGAFFCAAPAIVRVQNIMPVHAVYWGNESYTALYMSEDAPFQFSGFYTLVPMDALGDFAPHIAGYEIISAQA